MDDQGAPTEMSDMSSMMGALDQGGDLNDEDQRYRPSAGPAHGSGRLVEVDSVKRS